MKLELAAFGLAFILAGLTYVFQDRLGIQLILIGGICVIVAWVLWHQKRRFKRE